jgi:hypothetical protein
MHGALRRSRGKHNVTDTTAAGAPMPPGHSDQNREHTADDVFGSILLLGGDFQFHRESCEEFLRQKPAIGPKK